MAIFVGMRSFEVNTLLRRAATAAVALIMAAGAAEAQDFMGNFAPADSQNKTRREEAKTTGPAVKLPDKPNRVDAQGRKQGEWAKKYPNGRYRYVATFRDGKPVGKVKRFYPNGRISVTMAYDAGSDTCRVETFHESTGKRESAGQYVGGKREGRWVIYNEDGRPLEVSYYARGRLHGQQSLLYDDGRLFTLTTWVDSLREGPFVRYFPSGAKRTEANYHADELHGKYRTWGADGKITEEGQYADGVRVGRWHVRHPEAGGVEGDIIYDKHGLVVNKAEADSLQDAVLSFFEKQKGKFDDPQNYMNHPEDYVPFKEMGGQRP